MAVNLARSCKIWPKFSHVYRCLQSPSRFVFKNNVSIRQLATKARTTKEVGENAWKLAGKLTLGSGLIVALKLARSSSNTAHCEARNRLSDIQVLQLKESKFDWGKLWRLLKPHSWLLAVAIASAFIVALLNIKIPLALGSIVNVVSQFLSSQNDGRNYFEALKDPGIKLSIMYIAQAFFTFVYIHSLSCVGERMASQLREELFTNIIKQDIEFFDSHRTGELVNRLTADVQEFKSSFKMCISQGLRSVAQTAGCIVSLYVISPWLTGCIGVIVPTVIAVGSAMGKGLRELSKATQAQVARATSVCEEAISNVRTVRAFAMEDQEAHLYASEIQKARIMSEELGMGIALFQAGANLFLNGMVLATIGLGGSLLSQGQLTPGDLIAFLVATQTIQRSLGQLSLITGHAVRGLSAGARVFEYCDLRANIPLRGGKTIPFHSLFGEVEFRNVSFAYPARPDQTVLRNFSLKIPAGKVVALVGASGGGKSTTAALLERFYDVQEGRVLLDNQDIRQLDPSWLRGSAIGYINQEPILFATSIKENIRYGKPGATDQEVIEAARLANADEFIRQFPQGYETVVGERGATVSGGQKQRIAIARALLKNPSILILDEATSALDAESERVVQEALDRVAAGRTVLVVAHRLSTVRNADLIAVVANGRIVEMGTHESLRKLRGYYWELVRQQEKKEAS